MKFSLQSFKQRLQDHGNLIISLERHIIRLDAQSQPENPKTEPPACETSENESKLVLHNASDLPDVAMKEDEEKPGVEMTVDLSTTPETKDDTKERILEATLHPTADETAKEAGPMSEIKSEEPLFDERKGETLKVITESASQHTFKKEIKVEEEENAVSFSYCGRTIHI